MAKPLRVEFSKPLIEAWAHAACLCLEKDESASQTRPTESWVKAYLSHLRSKISSVDKNLSAGDGDLSTSVDLARAVLTAFANDQGISSKHSKFIPMTAKAAAQAYQKGFLYNGQNVCAPKGII